MVVGPAVVVVPPAELDLASAGELEQEISDAYLAGAGKVTVDFARVLFCDSSGLRVLVNAAQLARRRGVLFAVGNPTRQLLQMASIVGASAVLDLPSPPG
jgi:anti-anti-sigma factor